MYIQVILNSPISINFPELTYFVPEHFRNEVSVGSIVKVPFGNKKYCALVLSKLNQLTIDSKHKIKDIEQIIYSTPYFTENQIKLAHHISDYYLCSFYKSISLFLQKKIWNGSFKEIREISYELNDSDQAKLFIENNKRSKKLNELLSLFIEEQNLSDNLIRKEKKYSLLLINKLLENNLITKNEGKLSKNTILRIETHSDQKKHKLSDPQEEAFNRITNSNKKVSLIHGITGAGKTEIYLHLALQAFQENEQTLILVPEISLTPQFINYFHNQFQDSIAVIHSKLSEGEKCQEFMRIKNNEAKVIIGSRSSIFSPFSKLKYIIIDEEHSWTYKQDNTPRYHTRDIATEMTKIFPNLKVILGSATPSIESYYLANQSEYELIKLHERINGKLPTTEIVDLRNELRSGNFSIFSNTLQEKISIALDKKEQVILFLNRRGAASSVLCRDCGYTVKCKTCEIPMTYHEKRIENREWRIENKTQKPNNSLFSIPYSLFQSQGFLQCHYCNLISPTPLTCPGCESTRIKFIGIGTQKIEKEVHNLFPSAKTLRADSDTTSQKDSFKTIYENFKKQKADILIGTQMIGKGLHLPNVTVVGVILADLGLNVPDFRSEEKIFQLLTQVAGRAGRSEKEGCVVIQTYNPENFAIKSAAKHDYEMFYNNEINIREKTSLPPFGSLIKLTYLDKNLQQCKQIADKLYHQIKSKFTIQNSKTLTCNIAQPLYPRLYGTYRYNVWIKGEKNEIKKILHSLTLNEKWRIDIDPINAD